MNIEDIKVGKWYNVPFKVVEIKSGDIHMENGGIKAVCQPRELSEITSVERTERLWNGMCDVLFDDNGQKYAADLSKEKRNHTANDTKNAETAPAYDFSEKYKEACEYLKARGIDPFNMQNGIKNTDTSPKYDPNRLFREGDKVKPREHNGRIPWAKDMMLTVISDERHSGVTVRDEETGEERLMCVLFLELVTPVEELEPYKIEKNLHGWIVFKDIPGNVVANFNITHPHAKEAAEAECARLNAEHRKEQSND